MNHRDTLEREHGGTRGTDEFGPALRCALLLLLLVAARSSFAAEKRPNLPKQVQQSVKQAAIVLAGIDQALQANRFQDVETALKYYQSLLQDSIRDTQEYQKTHKKTPRQFKDAEIKVRRQLRRMADIRPALPLALRPTLNKAEATAKELRHLFLGELFNLAPPPPLPATPKLKRKE